MYLTCFSEENKTAHPNNYFPESTFEDVILTSTGVIPTARIYLLMWQAAEYDDKQKFVIILWCKSHRGRERNAYLYC